MIVTYVPMFSYFSIIYIRLTVSLVLSWLPWGPFTYYVDKISSILTLFPFFYLVYTEVFWINYISARFLICYHDYHCDVLCYHDNHLDVLCYHENHCDVLCYHENHLALLRNMLPWKKTTVALNVFKIFLNDSICQFKLSGCSNFPFLYVFIAIPYNYHTEFN